MGQNFLHLNSGGIYGPENEKSKYYSNEKINSTFVISVTENTLVLIMMSCVNSSVLKQSKVYHYST